MQPSSVGNQPFENLEHLRAKQGTEPETTYVNTATSLSELHEDRTFRTEDFKFFEDGDFKNTVVTLNSKTISFEDIKGAVRSFRLEDVLGATTKKIDDKSKKLKVNEDQADFYKGTHVLKVHFMIKPEEAKHSEEEENKPSDRQYDKISLYSHHEGTIKNWRNLILHAANNPNFKSLIDDKTSISSLPEYRRHIIVFIMAKSGQGKAVELWQQCIKPLTRGGCTYKDVEVTDFQVVKDFFEKSTTEELRKYDLFSSISGDGCPHSVMNMLMNRPDWDQISDIPFMLIPGGSCNALTQNILHRSGESTTLESCCYVIAKGRTFKSDLSVFELEDGRKIYSFQAMTWAIPANIDLDSETLRSVGILRFDIYGAWEALTLKRYKAKLSYSPTDTRPPKFDEEPTGGDWVTVDDDFSFFSIHNMPWIGLHYQAIPFLDLEDGINYLLAQKGEQITRMNLLKTRKLLRRNADSIKDEADLEKLGMTVSKIKSFRLEPYGERLGKYSIDGEEYEPQRIQGYVLGKAFTFAGYSH